VLKIHATRVSAPTPGHDTATRWQVAVTFDDGNTETFNKVRIMGDSTIVSIPDSEPTPHVYICPDENAHVIAEGSEGEGIILQ
jgi:hypothetical protein